MSLKKLQILNNQELGSTSNIIDICPNIQTDEITVTFNNQKVEVVGINKVLEFGGEKDGKPQYIYSYLIQVFLGNEKVENEYNQIHIVLHDQETDEYGEGTVFWKPNLLK